MVTFSIDPVKLVSEDAMLKEVVDPETTHYAFSMCNPPFFKSEEEKLGGLSSHGDLRPLPSTFSTGTEKETTTEGGEVEFVKRMIEDSLTLRDRIRQVGREKRVGRCLEGEGPKEVGYSAI